MTGTICGDELLEIWEKAKILDKYNQKYNPYKDHLCEICGERIATERSCGMYLCDRTSCYEEAAMRLTTTTDYAPAQMYRMDVRLMGRKERREVEFMRPGMRVEEARRMYNELKRFAVQTNDEAIAANLIRKFYPYVRMDKPLPMSKTKSDQLRKLYNETRADIIAAHKEDSING